MQYVWARLTTFTAIHYYGIESLRHFVVKHESARRRCAELSEGPRRSAHLQHVYQWRVGRARVRRLFRELQSVHSAPVVPHSQRQRRGRGSRRHRRAARVRPRRVANSERRPTRCTAAPTRRPHCGQRDAWPRSKCRTTANCWPRWPGSCVRFRNGTTTSAGSPTKSRAL